MHKGDGVLFLEKDSDDATDHSGHGHDLQVDLAVLAAVEVWEKMHEQYYSPTIRESAKQLVKSLARSVRLMKS